MSIRNHASEMLWSGQALRLGVVCVRAHLQAYSKYSEYPAVSRLFSYFRLFIQRAEDNTFFIDMTLHLNLSLKWLEHVASEYCRIISSCQTPKKFL